MAAATTGIGRNVLIVRILGLHPLVVKLTVHEHESVQYVPVRQPGDTCRKVEFRVGPEKSIRPLTWTFV
ncbi:MAG TPA: hypothetical protein VK425_13075 [Acidimicrobiales bacterium]|nr:hypothetical protein [Acidimicrobiales bacterium]